LDGYSREAKEELHLLTKAFLSLGEHEVDCHVEVVGAKVNRDCLLRMLFEIASQLFAGKAWR
jgi:hypothetical protein